MGVAVGILASVTTDISFAPEIGLLVGGLLGWFAAGLRLLETLPGRTSPRPTPDEYGKRQEPDRPKDVAHEIGEIGSGNLEWYEHSDGDECRR